ncbi:hypothetical protein [uncultured Sphingomonas sp.]|uniref:hypothetical protein n=1 Tax=uncultured Sphingomonas sp. TaxID=158754 RepID=UPI0035CC9115
MTVVMRLAQYYHELTLWLQRTTGQTDTVLHIHAGLAILVVARLCTRRSFGSFAPFAFVAFAELANEALDRVVAGGWPVVDTGTDLLNTLFWPFAISLGVRLRPMMLKDRPRVEALRR